MLSFQNVTSAGKLAAKTGLFTLTLQHCNGVCTVSYIVVVHPQTLVDYQDFQHEFNRDTNLKAGAEICGVGAAITVYDS